MILPCEVPQYPDMIAVLYHAIPIGNDRAIHAVRVRKRTMSVMYYPTISLFVLAVAKM
jgi:hypothetical protein